MPLGLSATQYNSGSFREALVRQLRRIRSPCKYVAHVSTVQVAEHTEPTGVLINSTPGGLTGNGDHAHHGLMSRSETARSVAGVWRNRGKYTDAASR